jgi:glyoxylase-like metal-dependent hydrolase (beta-lactamase superfamily II)
VNLEDHIGDIIRKARQAANVAEATAAQTARLSEAEFRALEQAGRADQAINFAALAPLLGLNSRKLERIAKGWQPAEVDLTRWRELRVVTTTKNNITVNCYLIWDEVSREAALFDTGWDAQPVLKLIDENGVILRHLFLTHGHEDHIAAMESLRAAFPKLHLHTSSKSAPPQHRNRANDFIHLGSLRITNRNVPGHVEDGVIYVIGNWPEDAPHVSMTGDTIFAGSIATGLQSTELLKQKVREQIFSLPPATLLCPGHGPMTTVEEEKAHNPFF